MLTGFVLGLIMFDKEYRRMRGDTHKPPATDIEIIGASWCERLKNV